MWRVERVVISQLTTCHEIFFKLKSRTFWSSSSIQTIVNLRITLRMEKLDSLIDPYSLADLGFFRFPRLLGLTFPFFDAKMLPDTSRNHNTNDLYLQRFISHKIRYTEGQWSRWRMLPVIWCWFWFPQRWYRIIVSEFRRNRTNRLHWTKNIDARRTISTVFLWLEYCFFRQDIFLLVDILSCPGSIGGQYSKARSQPRQLQLPLYGRDGFRSYFV